MYELSGDDLLWNWTRWCWSGATVGNMEPYVPEDEGDCRPVNEDHAQAVDRLYRRLPRHEAMVVQAEYTRKNSQFGRYSATERRVQARRWIQQATGAVLRDEDYRRHLDQFRSLVEREVLP